MTKIINRCSICQKELGTSYCTGCEACFCTKDFKIHRGMLFSEMDVLITNRNDLLDRMKKAIQDEDSRNPLFTQIDTWEKTMIEKVKTAAEYSRQQVIQLVNSKRITLNDEFQKFSEELVNLKETENFVEDDLTRLKNKILDFNYQLKQLTKAVVIELHTELSDQLVWDQLIYAEEKVSYTRSQQRPRLVKSKMIS